MNTSIANLLIFAVPGFLLLLTLEILWGKRKRTALFHPQDTAASLSMGVGNLITELGFKLLIVGVMLGVYEYRLFDIEITWWSVLLLFFVQDFIYYWQHRLSHEFRWFWASHVVHHSSQHYNLSTALRQTWTGLFSGAWLLSIPMTLLGFPVMLIAVQTGISLVYQFWIHTETIGKMWRPIELVFNTPSHHRVHHATNTCYLDRNYAGILILWDRMFGTFAEEHDEQPCTYGLVHQIGTFNPVKIALHEWVALFKDVFAKHHSWKTRWMYMF
ncbi:MAG: sterol desaturase family protein, partial [Myxococcota bacterium]